MKFKAIINQRDGGRVILELSCREYHAQKLNYILSRTLDRSIYYDAAVVAVDAVDVETATATVTRMNCPWNELTVEEKKELIQSMKLNKKDIRRIKRQY